jgi:hypothetical protein
MRKGYYAAGFAEFTGEERQQQVHFCKDNVESTRALKLPVCLQTVQILAGVEIDENGEKKEIACDGLFLLQSALFPKTSRLSSLRI